MDRIQTGNGWVRKHGGKYPLPSFEQDITDSLRIKQLVKAYKVRQAELGNNDTVEDDYGYLSELAHPTSLCLSKVLVLMAGLSNLGNLGLNAEIEGWLRPRCSIGLFASTRSSN